MTAAASKNLHALVNGILSGMLAYISGVLAGAHLPGWRPFLVGTLTAGGSRLAGWLLAYLNRPPEA